MNTTGGYNFEIVEDQLVKDYECPICLLLIKEAVELPCAHTLCRFCLTKWEKDPADRNVGLLCPSCKEAYQHDQVTASRFTDRIITESLQIKCKDNKYGCEWTGTICEYNDHEKKFLFTVNCNFVDCEERVRRSNLEEHMKICEFRLVQCSYCGAEEQFNNVEEHHQICQSYPIVCMNKECEITMQRKECCIAVLGGNVKTCYTYCILPYIEIRSPYKVPSHIEINCRYQITYCQYKYIGCDVIFQRKNHQNHIDTFVQKHMELLLEHSMHTTIRLTATEQMLETTQTEHNETKQKLQTTNVQLQQTNQKLTDTTEELHATKMNLENTRKELKVTREKLRETIKTEQKFKDDFKSFDSLIRVLPEKAWKTYKEEQLQSEIEDCLYPWRFEKLVNVMEPSKIYYYGNKKIYIKLNLNNYINNKLIIYMCDTPTRISDRLNDTTISCCDEFSLDFNNNVITVKFFLPGWTKNNTYAYVIHPQRDEEIQSDLGEGCFDYVLQQEYILYGELLINLNKI